MKITRDFFDYIKKETNKYYKANYVVNVTCSYDENGLYGVITYASTQLFSTTKQRLFKFNEEDHYLYFQKSTEPTPENLVCDKKARKKFTGKIFA